MQEAPEYLINLQHQIAALDDQLAYKRLYEIFCQRLINFACSFVKSKEAAEEIVSDVFINIWLHRKKLPGINNIRIYLYAATKNGSLNYVKKTNHDYNFHFDDLLIEAADFVNTPEQLFITAELRRRIALAVQQLPAKCQIIFRLIKEDGLRYKEVAEILQLSIKTIEAQMGIALKKISLAIAPDLSNSATFKK